MSESESGYSRFSRRLLRGILTVVLAFLLSATLLRFSPGWNTDEGDLDARLSTSTMRQLRNDRAANRNLLRFYPIFLGQVVRGEFGNSELFGRPVRTLIAERAATTARSVATGVLVAWALALVVATITSRYKTGVITTAAATVSGALLSCPSALLAVLCLVLKLPPASAITAVVFPRIFPHAHEQLQLQFRATHVLMARARGIAGTRLFRLHVVPGALPALAALAGASIPLAFGASIPIESLADSPGLGQLAWRAALGRDMPLLVSLTLLLTIASVTANLAADVAVSCVRGWRK